MTSAGWRQTCLGGIVMIALALMAGAVVAQDFRGGLAGLVTDSTGGVLPGVTITVTNTETGVGQNIVTDAQGLYQVRYLIGGSYAVAAELTGFKKVIRSGYQVRVGDVVRVDIAMETGRHLGNHHGGGREPDAEHDDGDQRHDRGTVQSTRSSADGRRAARISTSRASR